MVDGKPEFMLWAGELEESGDFVNDKLVYLTEDEYHYIIKYLKDKGSIDEFNNRINGKAKDTQSPWINGDNNQGINQDNKF